MTKQIRWGILSTANIGRKRVIPAIHESHNGVVAAVASRDLQRAQQFAQETDISTAYGGYQDLIDDPDIDAIYIPTPNSEHMEWSLRCAEANKPTLCEKPLAANAEDAQKMVDAFEERNVLFAEAFMYRFHPQTQRVKAMIDDGAIGDLMAMQAAFTFTVNDESNVRLNKDLAGGSVMDVGCYCVNVMRLMSGAEPYRSHAFAHVGDDSGVDESLTGILMFSGNIVGHFDSSLRTYRTHTYELRGTQGRIRVDEGFVMSADSETVIHHWQGDDYQQITIPPANSYTLMVEDFADALLNEHPPRFPPQDAVKNMQVIDHLIASATRPR